MNKYTKSNKVRFLHLVDHSGTIFQLVSQLSVFPEHYILDSFSSFEEKISIIDSFAERKDLKVVLHATGNNKPFFNIRDDIARKFKNFYLFLHVSPNHFLIKNRLADLYSIKKLVRKYNLKILVPSKELKKEFFYYGLNTIPIQLGVDFKIDSELIRSNSSKKHISTVCTSEEEIYHYVKGVDLFFKLIKDFGLEKEAIVLGNNRNLFERLKSRRFSQRVFFKYLQNSIVYIQLSRTESYNLSAVYAKRLKIPIIVSCIEGHKNNIKYGFKVNNLREAKNILRKILLNPNAPEIKRVVERNYIDSLKRESLNNFRSSFNRV